MMARPSVPMRPMSTHFGSSSNSAFTPVQSCFGQLSSVFFTVTENKLGKLGDRYRDGRSGKFSGSRVDQCQEIVVSLHKIEK